MWNTNMWYSESMEMLFDFWTIDDNNNIDCLKLIVTNAYQRGYALINSRVLQFSIWLKFVNFFNKSKNITGDIL